MNIVRYNEVDDSSYIPNLDVAGRSIMMRRTLAILLSIIMMLTCYSPAFVSADKISSSSRDEKQRVTEVPEMRKPNSDTYLLSDGTYECVVYAEDKYFQDENGNYTKIDNTVEPVEYRNNANLYKFTNAANSVKVYFSDKKPSLLIKSGDETLAFSFVDSTAKTVRTGTKGNAYKFKDFDLRSDSCITYSEAREHTDFVYSVQNDCVKEYIILKDLSAPSEYLFEVDTSNYTIKKNNSDRLCVYNRQGKQVFEFGSLFAVDSAGKFTDKMEYIVEKVSDQKTTIKVAFTSDYLDDTERVFPVLIDPSVMVTGANKTKDTFVSSRYPTANYYMQNWLRTGHDETYELRRTYIKFDLPSFITADSISAAYMNIKYHSGSTPEVKAYRVTKHWTPSTLTWENRPRYNTVNVSSGTYQASNDWYKIYVTDIVRSWYAGTYKNYGFVLRDDVESTTSHWTTFYSSDAASPNKPELHIMYKEGQYLPYGTANKSIYVYPYSFNGTWQAAVNQSRYNWNNSSAPINFYTSSSSTNRIYVSQYDYDAYGITYALERSGSELTRFKIELNSRTITRDASTGNLANFIQSVLVHELGHTIWLADNPVTEQDSIMKYTRNRNIMISPTAYDIANVVAKYNKNGGK